MSLSIMTLILGIYL